MGHTDIARITLQFSAQLLEFSCVVRSLGVHCQVFIRTITRLLGEFKEDAATLDLLYSILLSFAKDPFIRNHLLKRTCTLPLLCHFSSCFFPLLVTLYTHNK